MTSQLHLPFSKNSESSVPLAHRMRPQLWENFEGQESLRPLIKAWVGSPHHLVLWGPSGSGKTTLVYLLAQSIERKIFTLNAVTSGVGELRKIVEEIEARKNFEGAESILFIDEIHRFNKSQQDALLPHLEAGTFLFLGATTEYPQTSLNRPLLSRLRTWELHSLKGEHVLSILQRGVEHLSRPSLQEFLPLIAEKCNGDARLAINILSVLHGFSQEQWETHAQSKESLLREVFAQLRYYDQSGQRHYDVISAFIKSVRGSDVDAALLWLAVMLDGGEDPEFIARRLMILSSEDIGLANSHAMQVAVNAHYVVKTVGMPEARLSLAHATIYLALSPKSNSAYLAIKAATDYVQAQPTLDIPQHLSNQAWGKGYQYPHDDSRGWVEQEYMPKAEDQPRFYEAKVHGVEAKLAQWLASFKAKS